MRETDLEISVDEPPQSHSTDLLLQLLRRAQMEMLHTRPKFGDWWASRLIRQHSDTIIAGQSLDSLASCLANFGLAVLQHHVEAEQLVQHAQEQLPLQIVSHSMKLVPVHAVVVVHVDQRSDVNALLRFLAADWSGHLVCRLCIIPLVDCASETCQKLVEIARVGSSGGQ